MTERNQIATARCATANPEIAAHENSADKLAGTSWGRRKFLSASGLGLASVGALASQLAWPQAASSQDATEPAATPPSASELRRARASQLQYCLNMSTINNSMVPVREQLSIAADAGYDSVELWVRDVDKFVAEGGKLGDLRKELDDLNLTVASAIAFGKWIVNDDVERAAGLEQCKRDMATIAELGGTRIAAPPVGATNDPGLDLNAAAERYRAALEIGKSIGVLPQLELWGFSANLSTLAEILFVAAAADHPDTCLLLDVYHMYKGGSNFNHIDLVPGQKMFCLHMNDYPAEPARAEIADKDRVYPGDGVAPLNDILGGLIDGGFAGTLSLELFNRSYWQQPPAEVAATGLAKMKSSVAALIAG